MGDEPVAGKQGPLPPGEPDVGGGTATVAPPTGEAWRHAFRDRVKEQLGLRGMISEYMIPVETNTFWYTLGGVLAIALVLEILSGMVLALRYIPDAGQAYQITSRLLGEGGWKVALNFHYWTSYVIFGLVMIHMLRVFFSGGYRGPRTGLWQIGVGLAGTVFCSALPGRRCTGTSAGSRFPGTPRRSWRPSGWTRPSTTPTPTC